MNYCRSLVTVGPGHADYVKNMITGVSWRQGLGCTREDNVDVVSLWSTLEANASSKMCSEPLALGRPTY